MFTEHKEGELVQLFGNLLSVEELAQNSDKKSGEELFFTWV